MLKSIKENTKKHLLVILLLTIGIVFVIISYLPKDRISGSTATPLDSYIEKTESRLCETISHIAGVGKARVFITTKNTFETVYASNASVEEGSYGKTTEKSLAYADGSSFSKEPIIVKELCPEIKGVLVVCEGGNNQLVNNEIINAISVALGIPKTKIYVSGGYNK